MRLTIGVIAGVVLMTGCRGAPSEEPPIVAIRNMYNQPRHDAQERSAFFADGRTMRPGVPGTVAREMEPDPLIATGWSHADSTWALTIPPGVASGAAMTDFVARGQGRYGVYCAPCHGLSGAGDGAVAKRAGGSLTPPTFHTDRVRQMPDGQVFATISRGVRNMPAYAHSVPTKDRWAIVAYLRALQLSQASGGG